MSGIHELLRVHDITTIMNEREIRHIHLPFDFSPEEVRQCIRALLVENPNLPFETVYQQFLSNLEKENAPILVDTHALFAHCFQEVVTEFSQSA